MAEPMGHIRDTDNTSHTSYMAYSIGYNERHALFCAHAGAVFNDDATEADRLQRLIYPEHFLAHQVFSFALFATCVSDHFGDDLDWASMDVLIEGVRRTAPGVSVLKTEALVRTCYDEPHLLMEVPQSEQTASFWAVCRLIIGTDSDENELADLFERAEESGREAVRGIFAASQLYAWRGEAERNVRQ
ncbi:hypothetical protein [Glycomyces arizonensis]|uniref:hypothetical protein n=1 Tax=Glycomyces arizonensis TaxID=256035 RepID=UPI0012EC8E8C|nr:hypothetical protein [Glycomyces arizonensis]